MAAPVRLEDFLVRMQYSYGSVYCGGKTHKDGSIDYSGSVNKEWGYWGNWDHWGWGSPQWQPHCLIFAVPLPEPVYYNIADYMCGTGGLWWEYTKVREAIAAAPTSRLHGDMLGKQSFQRKDAKEMLATVQTMKTVILNLESDLEKIKEQKDAFDKNSPEQVKGLFVDNYGGPSRSWSALAREVPIVKSSLTWFYRLEERSPEQLSLKKEKDESDVAFRTRWADACQKDMEKQADEFVAKEDLNPAVANYLKRKVQEYWNWRNNYKTFIYKTYNSIIQNIRQQRANLELYIKWAKRNVQEAENMLIPYDEMSVKFAMFAEEFPQFAPLAYTTTEMFYDPEKKWPIVIDRMKPWIPCIGIELLMTYNPDIQGNKFVRGFSVWTYGVIHQKHKKMLQDKLAAQKSDFLSVLKNSAGLSDEEVAQLGLSETKDERNAITYEEKSKKLKELKDKAADGLTKDEKEELKTLTTEVKDLATLVGIEEAEKSGDPAKAAKSAMAEMNEWFKSTKIKKNDELYKKSWEWRENFIDKQLIPLLKFFGNETPKVFDTRRRRAEWFAFNSFFRTYHGMKASMGWMDYV